VIRPFILPANLLLEQGPLSPSEGPCTKVIL